MHSIKSRYMSTACSLDIRLPLHAAAPVRLVQVCMYAHALTACQSNAGIPDGKLPPCSGLRLSLSDLPRRVCRQVPGRSGGAAGGGADRPLGPLARRLARPAPPVALAQLFGRSESAAGAAGRPGRRLARAGRRAHHPRPSQLAGGRLRAPRLLLSVRADD